MSAKPMSALRGIIDYDVIRLEKESLGLSEEEMMEAINNILLSRQLQSYMEKTSHGLVFNENPNDIVSEYVLADVIDYLASLNLYNTEETLGYLNELLRDNLINLRLIVYAWPESPVRYEYEVVGLSTF